MRNIAHQPRSTETLVLKSGKRIKATRSKTEAQIAKAGSSSWNWGWRRIPTSDVELDELQRLQRCWDNCSNRWRGSLAVGMFGGVWVLGKGVKRLYQRQWSQVPFYSYEWSNWVPSKVNILCWIAKIGRLPTHDMLTRRNIGEVPRMRAATCVVMQMSVEHIFIGCEVASNVLDDIASWCKRPLVFGFSVCDLVNLRMLPL
ncbi:hypothetical protein SSX86_001476 [Deinandra increscens subsp. villosa]|uniref:Reverse transcriptase zinc-binding domain-containing protein n=1 Tax=Deinandra increscens subsp. villosa TaxID=3103831 RepID=A0AAP0DV17_9ASTR